MTPIGRLLNDLPYSPVGRIFPMLRSVNSVPTRQLVIGKTNAGNDPAKGKIL